MTTSESLKAAATELFALKGYQNTSVKEICEKAKSNVAAVNYHFGSKAGLYCEIVADFFEKKKGCVAFDLEVPLPVMLTQFYADLLDSFVGVNGPLMQIMMREQLEPSGLLNDMRDQHLKEKHEMWVSYLQQKTNKSREEAEVLAFSLVGALLPFVQIGDWVERFLPNYYSQGQLSEEGRTQLINMLVAQATILMENQ